MKLTFWSKSLGILGLIAALSALVSVSGQEPAQSSSPNLTIAEIVTQSGGEYDNNPQDFDILLNALKQNDLVGALADKNADVTVFAPTDAAFLKLSRFFGYKGNDEAAVLDTINQAFTQMNQFDVANGGSDPNAFNMRDVLLYHVSPGAKTLDKIQNLPDGGSIVTLLNWGDSEINANRIAYVKGNLIDAAPNLIAPKIQAELTDVAASNGTVQGIDRVLLPYFIGYPSPYPVLLRTAPPAGQPMTIADVLAQSGSDYDDNRQDYDILNKLLQTAEFTEVLADPNANLTLFAPTDAAFIEYAQYTTGGAPLEPDYQEGRAYDQLIRVTSQVDQVITQDVYVGGDAVPLLQKVLQFHVSPGAKTASEIQAASSIVTLLGGATITPRKDGTVTSYDGLVNSQFQPGKTNVRASNGVIQSIDNILVPTIEQVK